MNLLKELDKEHRLIEEAAGSIVTLARKIIADDTQELRSDMQKLCRFLSDFVVTYHTKKEEKVLFQAFGRTGLPLEKGPLYYYDLEHKQHDEYTRKLLAFLEQGEIKGEAATEFEALAIKFCGELWEHIDKEDSVLFEEVVDRIKGKNLRLLEEALSAFQKESGDTEELINIAKEIIARHKPIHDLPDVFRGDGCVSCRHYGEGCSGIEHEWWTEHEWEDFYARNNRD